MEIEAQLGADIILPLDECPPYPCPPDEVRQATLRTHRWAELALAARIRPREQALFGILQGGMDAEARIASANFIAGLPFDGFSIGGLSVGEPKPIMWQMLDAAVPQLPNSKPRHFRDEQGPVDADCDCYTCRTFSAGYLHHLIRSEGDDSRGELLYFRLASIHNLRFLIRLVEGARQAILNGTFPSYRARFQEGFVPPNPLEAAEQRKKRATRLGSLP
jgi:queuine tRNA-ribosyltransferase